MCFVSFISRVCFCFWSWSVWAQFSSASKQGPVLSPPFYPTGVLPSLGDGKARGPVGRGGRLWRQALLSAFLFRKWRAWWLLCGSGRDRMRAWGLSVVGAAWLLCSEEGSPCGRGTKAGAPTMSMPPLTPQKVTDWHVPLVDRIFHSNNLSGSRPTLSSRNLCY